MSKSNIEFFGDVELLKKLEEAGKNVEEEIIKALRVSTQKPQDEMLSFIRKRKRSGRTEESFGEKIVNKNGVITAEIGFSVRKGGLASIFWNVGTPRNAPPAHWFIDNAVEKNIDEIIAEQNRALLRSFRELTN